MWLQNTCVIICSLQASLNRFQFEHLKLFIEQARDKCGRIARLGLYTTEKANSYANYFYKKINKSI